MNWYKISQNYYTDIGHYQDSFAGESNPVIWTCDPLGNNFKMLEVEDTDDNHYAVFGSIPQEHYWGRYDPSMNKISVSMYGEKQAPNRLIKRLMSEFPGATIWAFAGKGSPTQII
jgi:hypothetical protein